MGKASVGRGIGMGGKEGNRGVRLLGDQHNYSNVQMLGVKSSIYTILLWS